MHVSYRQTKSRGQASLREQERGDLDSFGARKCTKVNMVAGQQQRPAGRQLERFSGLEGASRETLQGTVAR